MADGDAKVRRILQFKFKFAAAEPARLAQMVKASSAFYEMFGGTRIRLLQNVDDPTQFVQVMEYDAPEFVELNRQRVASDPRIQGFLQAWRAVAPGAVEIDVYEDVTDAS